MDLGLKERVAIVTGASAGIGRAVAERLCQEGARLCIVARDAERLEKARAALGPDVMAVAADVAADDTPAKVVDGVLARWGRIDILVHNAGGPPPGGILAHTDDVWHAALNTNLLSAARFIRAALPAMQKGGFGRVVAITSTIAKEPTPQMVLSATARAGLTALFKALSQEFAADGITFNTVGPGGVETDRLRSLLAKSAATRGISPDEAAADAVRTIPAKRFAHPSELGDVIAFLCSERAAYLTGQALMVDGGLTKTTF